MYLYCNEKKKYTLIPGCIYMGNMLIQGSRALKVVKDISTGAKRSWRNLCRCLARDPSASVGMTKNCHFERSEKSLS